MGGGEVKIFRMNDCDWMAGESLEECKRKYHAQYSSADIQAAREIKESDYDKILFSDGDGKVRSFREQLNRMIESGVKFPTFFASTEY